LLATAQTGMISHTRNTFKERNKMSHEITLEIEDSKWFTFKLHFLQTHPNQTKDLTETLTDEQWIAYKILLFALGAYIKGLTEEFQILNKPQIDNKIITIKGGA